MPFRENSVVFEVERSTSASDRRFTTLGDPLRTRLRAITTRLTYSISRRAFFYWASIWVALVTVVCGICTVATLTVVRKHGPGAFLFWSRLWGRSIALGIGIRIRTELQSNYSDSTAYVFTLNHQVALDIPAAGTAIPLMFGWVAKAELGRVPFLGWAIKASPSVFVDRSQPRKSVESIRTAAEKIRGGVSVAIFPEGSRSYSGDLGPFMRGAFVLAIEAGVPVVPVTIKNAHELFNEKTKLARPGTLHITVGKPIVIDGWTRSDIPRLMEEVRVAMQSELDAWSRTDQPSVALSASNLAKSPPPEQDIEPEI